MEMLKSEEELITDFNKCFDCIFDASNEIDKHYRGMIYHYSNSSAVQAIFETQTLRISNLTDMNDSSEWCYAINLINELIAKGKYSELLKNIFIKSEKRARLEIHKVYSMSFSKNPDNEYLWSNYAQNTGYALGFHSGVLSNVISELSRETTDGMLELYYHMSSGSVIYNIDMQKTMLETMLNAFNHFLIQNNSAEKDALKVACEFLKYQIFEICAYFKHPDYSKEDEYRFVFTEQKLTEEKRHKIEGKNKIVVDFQDEKLKCKCIPVYEIINGNNMPLHLKKIIDETLINQPRIRNRK